MADRSDREWKWLDEPGRHHFGRGLYLQVVPSSSADSPNRRSWIMRYQIGGRVRDLGLGSAGSADGVRERGQLVITLADAEKKVLAARGLLAQGIDPLDHKRAARGAVALAAAQRVTFAEATERFFKLHQAKWRSEKHAAQFLKSLQDHAAAISGMAVGAIDTPAVLRCLEPIWASKTETASRVRSRIERILDFAKVQGWRAGENPALWRGHLAHVLPAPSKVAKVEHFRALAVDAMPEFMAELAQHDNMAARALEFLILTAARPGEVIGARWAEIDLEAALWSLPGERMKSGRPHRVPLSSRAVALLRKLPRVSAFVFPGLLKDSGISHMALHDVLKRMGRMKDATVHGFRSTFRDWCAERTSFPRDIAEMCLAHAVGDAVERAYRRGDALERRRELMEAWTGFCYGAPTAQRRTRRRING